MLHAEVALPTAGCADVTNADGTTGCPVIVSMGPYFGSGVQDGAALGYGDITGDAVMSGRFFDFFAYDFDTDTISLGDRILFRGRRSEVINVGGVKVHPFAVEERVLAVPGVDIARVFGRPNRLSGAIVAVGSTAVSWAPSRFPATSKCPMKRWSASGRRSRFRSVRCSWECVFIRGTLEKVNGSQQKKTRGACRLR